MNFQELGLTLQREREAKGLTIEAVMEATKISRINLVAIENGDRSSLPHPVYTKGFVKSYARLLELDADELSMAVDREYQSESMDVEEMAYDVSPGAEKALQEPDAPSAKKRSVWPSILIFIALVCAIVLLVLNLNKEDVVKETAEESKTVEQVAPEVDKPEMAEPQVEEPAPAAEQVEPQEEQIELEEGAPEVVPAEQSPAAEDQPESSLVPPEQPVATETKPEESQVAGQDEVQYAHVLVIRATTNKGCWIGLWKGDEPNMARDFVLKKGEPLRLMFNNPRRIRIGNVAGVEVTYNGKPYPLEDNKSNIQTLVFGKN